MIFMNKHFRAFSSPFLDLYYFTSFHLQYQFPCTELSRFIIWTNGQKIDRSQYKQHHPHIELQLYSLSSFVDKNSVITHP